MKRNNKGFTLIELIMVIVILGILAAVAVPKFFNFASQAHTKSKAAFIGNLNSALGIYGAQQAITTGAVDYPDGTTSILTAVLDQEDSDWTFVADANTNGTGRLYYDPEGDQGTTSTYDVSYTYTYTSGSPNTYSLTLDGTTAYTDP